MGCTVRKQRGGLLCGEECGGSTPYSRGLFRGVLPGPRAGSGDSVDTATPTFTLGCSLRTTVHQSPCDGPPETPQGVEADSSPVPLWLSPVGGSHLHEATTGRDVPSKRRTRQLSPLAGTTGTMALSLSPDSGPAGPSPLFLVAGAGGGPAPRFHINPHLSHRAAQPRGTHIFLDIVFKGRTMCGPFAEG